MTGRQDEFSERMEIDGALGMYLCEYLWQELGTIHLAGHDFELISGEDVPGYENDNMAVLLRRTSDGQIFDAEIDVSVHRVKEAAS